MKTLDLADHVRADVDLEFRIDFTRRADDRLDLLRLHRLGVNLLALWTAAFETRPHDRREREDDDHRDDDLLRHQ